MDTLIATYVFSAALVVVYIVRMTFVSRQTLRQLKRLQAQRTDVQATGPLKKTA